MVTYGYVAGLLTAIRSAVLRETFRVARADSACQSITLAASRQISGVLLSEVNGRAR